MSPKSFLASKQAALIRSLPERATLCIFAPKPSIRNYDVEHPFRQHSDFYYLTHQELSPAIWAIQKAGNKTKRVLFYTPKPEVEQRWVGKDRSLKDLQQESTWDEASPLASFDHWLEEALNEALHLYLPFEWLPKLPSALWTLIKQSSAKHHRRGAMPPVIHDTYELLAPLRQIKSSPEIAALRKACEVSSKAHIAVMQQAHPGMSESQMAGLFESVCHSHGSHRLAYPCIVASGSNTTVLHYMPSRKKPKDTDIILMDAGCEWDYFASDITRVFPMGKKFTPPQKDIYEAVLEIQKKIISLVRPGLRHQHLQEQTIRLTTQALVDLKVLKGSVDSLIKAKAYEEYYYHGVSHFLGMDVHDTGPYRESSGGSVLLKEGMVMTVEPGIYFFKKGGKYLGIGVRIEDDILVTADGHEILSHKTPKEVRDIESLRQG